MGKYFNLLEKNKDLVIDSMGKTIQIFKGVSDYPDEIAEKFPSIFESMEEVEVEVVFDIETDEIDSEYEDDHFDDIFELCDHEDGEDCDCIELCDEKCEDCDCEINECFAPDVEEIELESEDEFEIECLVAFDEDDKIDENYDDDKFDDLKEIEDLLDDEPEDQPETPEDTGDIDEEVMNDISINKDMAEKIDWVSIEKMTADMNKEELDVYAENYFSVKLDKRKSIENMMKDLESEISILNKEV